MALYSVGFSVNAAGGEFNESFITEELKLLANFGFDVVVLRMLSPEHGNESIHLFQCEGRAEFLGALENIEQPAAAFDAPCLQ